MFELYMMIFLCVIITIGVGVLALSLYAAWVVLMHDLEEKKKEDNK